MPDDTATIPPPCPKCGGPRFRYKAKTQWQVRCRACIAAKARERYRKDPLADNRRSRATYAANRERAALSNRAWRDAHPDYMGRYNAAYYVQNREAEIARSLAYTKANPDMDRASKHRRQARQREVVCEHGDRCVDAAFLAGIRASSCLYCDAPAEQADHFLPLSRGGLHCRDNIVPACGPCNHSKHARDPWAWIESRIELTG